LKEKLMNRTVMDMMVDAMAAADPVPNGTDYFRGHITAALSGARAELTALRGDPRAYGQGFADPIGGLINSIDALLLDKPVT
jgi:hypothetical protein